MAYTNSKLVSYTKLSPNHSGQRTHSIDRITPHCVVGQLSAESICGCFTSTDRQASCNYGIGTDGRISLCVEEKNRSWCSSSNANDQRAITIECASDMNAPYAMNSKVYDSLINLCTDICQRNGKKKLLWLGDKDKTLNYSPASNEMVLTVHRWFANKSCVPVDTEVLTRDGWVQLRHIHIGDEIACASLDNLHISFEEVMDKVEERRQDTYTSNGLTATKDHRMVYAVQQDKEQYRIDYYKHLLRKGTQIYIPMAGHVDNEGLPITDSMLTFLIAVQADGHYMYERKADGAKSYYGVEFHMKKERKIERLLDCLKACHLEYTLCNQSDGTTKIRIYNKEGINIVTDICERWLKDKCFTWEWLNLSEKQAHFVLDEILLWDGCTAANLYCSRQEINLDVISALAALNGVGSNVTGSNIQFRENPYITLGEAKRNRYPTDSTLVSCVTVKTGIFLCRQNGKTFIIGNCPGDWLYNRLSDLASKVTAKLGGTSNTTQEVAPTTNTAATSFPAVPFTVKVLIDDLNYRSQPSMSGAVKGQTGKGVFTITAVSDGWGKLKSGAGWIYLENPSYCTVQGSTGSKTEEKTETVTATTGTQASVFKSMTEAQAAAKIGELCKADMVKSGILASVSAAQFILESGYGKSELAQNANNCFGMKCSLSGNTWAGTVWDGKSKYAKQTSEEYTAGQITTITADFRKYASVEDSVADHSAYLNGAMNGSKLRYDGLKGCTDYKKAIQIIKDGGYATSSTYVANICSIIEKYNLTQYDVTVASTQPTEQKAEQSKTSADKVIAVAVAEIGYHEKASNVSLDDKTANSGTANYTKYARDFDQKYPNWYNGKKNGYAWCDMFVDWCFLTAFGYAAALTLLCQPEKSAGAGCTYSMRYFKNKGQFYTSNPKAGDQIFFGDSADSSSHTGIVEKVDSSKVYTIEGNSSDQVIRRTYTLSNSSILGYGRPAYDTVATTTEQKTEEQKVEQSTVPYCVRISISDLNIRKGPGTDYGKTGKYTGKGVFTIVEEADGQGASRWGKLKSGAGWVSLDYTTKV